MDVGTDLMIGLLFLIKTFQLLYFVIIFSYYYSWKNNNYYYFSLNIICMYTYIFTNFLD